MSFDGSSGLWVATVGGISAFDTLHFVQAMDAAGNVTLSANKGAFYSSLREVFLPAILRNTP